MSNLSPQEKIELLDWITKQDRLRVETWNYLGRKKLTSVWTIFDEDEKPSGKAPTVLGALMQAKKAQES